MTKRDYNVQEPLTHDGTRYEPGTVVPGLTDEQAAPLLAAKPPVIAPANGLNEPAGSGDSGQGAGGSGGDGTGGGNNGDGGTGDQGDGDQGDGQGGDGNGDQPTEPTDPTERHQRLVGFMVELTVPDDPKGEKAWTNGGKPDVYALAQSLGWDSVSAKERDGAWTEVEKARNGGGGE